MTSTAEVAPGKGGKQQLELPEEKGNYYYQKAKVLYSKGQGYSIILEKVLLYLFKAIAYVPHETKNYMFLAKVYLNSLDWSSFSLLGRSCSASQEIFPFDARINL